MTVVFRVVKTKNYTMMSNQHLKDKRLTLKAKGLMSVMLSLPENWDYTLRGLSAISKEGVDAISEAVKELERSGYVIRNRKRDERGRLSGTEYLIYEDCHMNSQPALDAPEPEKPKRENPRLENPVQEKPVQENPKQEKPEQENPAQLNTNRSNTNSEKTYPPNTQGENPYPSIHLKERQEDVAAIRDSVRSQIGYDCLVTPYNRDRMDEIVELMVEILCTGRKTITISGAEYPVELVKERMRKINSMHIEYIFGCLEQNASRVRNIKKYLLTTLFNAPATMGNYYDAQVRYDRRKREEDYENWLDEL